MTEISRSALFGRLDATALKAIETATGFCKMRGNPYVELVHWIHILMQDPRNDLALIRATFKLDDAKLARDIVEALDELPRGATAISDFSPQIEEAIEKGWLYASLQFSAARVRTGHLVYGMLKTPTLRNALFNASTEFRKIQVTAGSRTNSTRCWARRAKRRSAAASPRRKPAPTPAAFQGARKKRWNAIRST